MKSTILFIQGIFLSTALAFASIQTHAATVNDSTSPNASMAQKPNLDQENKQAGERFMIDNQSKANVVTLPSGLQYQILETGTGKKPSINDTVKVHYEGKLLNGQIFDSSYQRNQPATFPVSGVITGWQEALQLMNEGSTWMLYIPPSLAYGQRGAGTMIGPNETLVFKVQLISIQPN